jgi:hypothetical protein
MQCCGEWVCTEVAATATDDEGIEHEDTQQQQQQASNEQTSTAQLNGDNTDTAKKPNKIVVAINSLFNTVYRMTVATIYRFAAVEPGIVQTISASLSLSLSLTGLATCYMSRTRSVALQDCRHCTWPARNTEAPQPRLGVFGIHRQHHRQCRLDCYGLYHIGVRLCNHRVSLSKSRMTLIVAL